MWGSTAVSEHAIRNTPAYCTLIKYAKLVRVDFAARLVFLHTDVEDKGPGRAG